ncbi:MAG: hypothetical protein U0836_27055 [Pirellulales bacterium]
MNLWLSTSARSLAAMALVFASASVPCRVSDAACPTRVTTSVTVHHRCDGFFCQGCAAQRVIPAHRACAAELTWAQLTSSDGEDESRFGEGQLLGWVVSLDPIHPPSRRALHALGDRATTALERCIQGCRLTL